MTKNSRNEDILKKQPICKIDSIQQLKTKKINNQQTSFYFVQFHNGVIIELEKKYLTILQLMTGEFTVREICQQFKVKYESDELLENIEEEVSDFVQDLSVDQLIWFAGEKQPNEITSKRELIEMVNLFKLFKKKRLNKLTDIFISLKIVSLWMVLLILGLTIASIILFLISGGIKWGDNFVDSMLGILNLKSYLIGGSYTLTLAFNWLIILPLGTWHELGHATFNRKGGAQKTFIGIGIYLLSPIFYTNIDESRMFSLKEKIAVNLGGIYFQLFPTIICAFLFPFTQGIIQDMLRYFVLFSLGSIVFNLNPLFMSDGYWVIEEITGISNLRWEAFRYYKTRTFSFPYEKGEKWMIRIYGLLSVLNTIFLVGLTLGFLTNSLVTIILRFLEASSIEVLLVVDTMISVLSFGYFVYVMIRNFLTRKQLKNQ
ncbi:MAG: hypothetical protein GF308_06565 [Candidatus Heimdallarchaeota archaeon]|nr:hypothetical protein [Candidatus Heimdallarchaeota archaeon]